MLQHSFNKLKLLQNNDPKTSFHPQNATIRPTWIILQTAMPINKRKMVGHCFTHTKTWFPRYLGLPSCPWSACCPVLPYSTHETDTLDTQDESGVACTDLAVVRPLRNGTSYVCSVTLAKCFTKIYTLMHGPCEGLLLLPPCRMSERSGSIYNIGISLLFPSCACAECVLFVNNPSATSRQCWQWHRLWCVTFCRQKQ